MYIVLYLAAIVIANMSVAQFGPSVAVVNAFLFIGFNLTCRDRLHERWRDRNLKRNMLLLIIAGGLISLVFGAGRIALASMAAFVLSESADAITYHILGKRRRLVQVNGSNVVGALVDSIAFPALAFGLPLLWLIMAGQFAAKIAGGFIWSIILFYWKD